MDSAPLLILAAFLAAGAILGRGPRFRAWAMLLALLVTPAILYAHVHDNTAFDGLRHHPSVAAAAAVVGVVAIVGLAFLFDRRPEAFPLLAVAALPFRIPIDSGGSTSNLLVPLYAVVGAGALAYIVPRLRGRPTPEEPTPGWLERVLAATVVLYAIQASYSSDFSHGFENVVFFYIPFALLFVLLGRVRWTRQLATRCLVVLVALALVLVGIGFVEYATRHLLLNPKVISSNQFESYFRVNSLFFDPNIYGRFLAVVMIGVTGVVLWSRRQRDVALGAAVLAVLWAGLVLTFSQSSFAALLLGLAVLGGLRWSPRWAATGLVALLVVGGIFVAVAPGAIRLKIGDSKSADSATSGRYALVKGGLHLFGDRPLQGYGAGSFPREFRRHEDASREKATSASHTIPVTVAAEQGVVGLALYLALLVLGFRILLRGASRSVERAVVGAAFAAVVLHTFTYASFLEDPLTWALLAVGAALARAAPRERRRRRSAAPDEANGSGPHRPGDRPAPAAASS